jgi:predicted nicotinamide N-methyase
MERTRRRIQLENGEDAALLSRTVPISSNLTITIWEWEKPAEEIEAYWEAQQSSILLGACSTKSLQEEPPLLDPFGIVSWPGALVASRELVRASQDSVREKTVLILGAGVGMEAMAAAELNARRVIASDIHPTTLKQIEFGAKDAGLDGVIEICEYNLFSKEPLPGISDVDLIVVADVLYSDKLASQVSKRLVEALSTNPSVQVLVTDSQRFALNFETELNEGLKSLSLPPVSWKEYLIENFTGSGVSVNEDQTYDVTTRALWINNK